MGPPVDPVVQYASYLRACYNAAPTSQAYKCPLTTPPSTHYIDLAIVESERASQNPDQLLNTKVPITDVLKLKCRHGEKQRFVLIEGTAGVGKSTFACELCRRWDSIEVLKQYSLVVLVQLRDERIQHATSLADVFYHTNAKLQHAVVQQVEATEGDGVLLIMDGADECPASFWKSAWSLGFKIMSGLLLPNATLLVTTRPSATTTLTGQWEPQKRFKILGFATDQIYQYAERTLSSEPQVLKGFHEYVSSTPSVEYMLNIPLNTAIAVYVYRENREKSKPVPTTLTQLYTDFSLILLQQYLLDSNLVADTSALPQSLHDLPKPISDKLLALAEVAYQGTIEQELVFSELPEGSVSLGFTTTSAELHTGTRLTYHFLHLTLQEYLAAFYFSLLPATQQRETFVKHCFTSHLNTMWVFVAGLTRFQSIGWEVVKQTYVGGNYSSMSFLRLLYEIRKRETIQAVLGSETIIINESYIDPGKSTTVKHPLDYFALGYCIINSRCTWQLFLQPQHREQMEMFFSGIQSQSHAFSSIHTLKFWNSELKESVVHFRELPLSGIHELHLSGCGLDNAAFSSLAHDVIPGTKRLEILDISRNKVCSSEFVGLLHALSEIQSLHTLNLGSLALGCDDITALARLVAPQRGSLKELTIGSKEMQTETVRQMTALLLAQTSLQKLFIEYTTLQPSTGHLAELLETNRNLETLGMHYCWGGASECAKALCKNSTLRTLIVNWSEIGEAGANLAEALKVNRSLQKLRIDFDYDIGEEGEKGLKVLNDALQHNNTVELELPWKL